MIHLIKKGNVFCPEPRKNKDILILGETIEAVAEPGTISIKGIDVDVLDASEKFVFPGLVDSHVHILGGGGEGGQATRAPEIRLENIILSGVTTLIGCLGTDGTTRHMTSLLAKAKGLEAEGITTHCFVGSYEIPVNNITGSVRSDLILLDKIIGAGEIAISDHRSSQPTFDEFSRLAAECRVGGMLGGKAGVLHCHMGNGPNKMELLFRLIDNTEIPITQIIPTHVNRNTDLLQQGIEFMKRGGYIDLTAGETPDLDDETHLSVTTALQICLENKAPVDQITISSDSNGSLPVFDTTGNLTGLTIATQKSLLVNLRHIVQNSVLKPEEAIRLFSSTPASFYKLNQKGQIKKGNDADIIVLDKNFHLTDVYAKGRRMMKDGQLTHHSTFIQ